MGEDREQGVVIREMTKLKTPVFEILNHKGAPCAESCRVQGEEELDVGNSLEE